MPRPDSERPVVEALAVGPLSQRYRTFTAMPHFASVITLAKWRYPFENSASLAKRPRARPRAETPPLKPRHREQNSPSSPDRRRSRNPPPSPFETGRRSTSTRSSQAPPMSRSNPLTGNLAPGGAITGTRLRPRPAPTRSSWAPQPPPPTHNRQQPHNRQQWDAPPPCPPPPRRQQDGNNGANAPPTPPRGSS